jgi:hypothetical protein
MRSRRGSLLRWGVYLTRRGTEDTRRYTEEVIGAIAILFEFLTVK